MTTVLAVAHRGDPYRHRENTLPSIAAALAAGADAVEVDVRLTRDGVPVLLHDPTLKRLWEDPRPVDRLTAAELAEVGRPGLRVPTLAEALKSVAEVPAARLLIDLDDPAPVAATLAAVTDLGAREQVAFCGPVAAMAAVRELAPDAEILLTWKQPRLPGRPLLDEVRPRYLNPPFGMVDARLVDAAHDAGLSVATWTVDLRRTMRRMLDAGVDSLTSNRIALLRSTIDRTAAGRPV
ncbi:glycerophosphodiester phosphodiesterase [Kitasatospora paracochleata]|uniref:Glycerophosphoryl diester phosphodiesterase n=1 Tax=Kitasatospora paracochleata TaxID=58354 RepID=A0ABT1J7W6_9ACTN|nr:glycerophosphodiester phosphodiesterase [Kitasatospora paracochleata]MCP2313537.1 glycerophosphoryl diester phosphodiesterase [Kitasatospora paracochleata]